LNTSLTVEDGKPNSHQKCGWLKFTNEVINVVNKNCTGVVYFLWGKQAQDKAQSINHAKNKILTTSHPKPRAVKQGFY
jgi:uracil-DNA glycosylase